MQLHKAVFFIKPSPKTQAHVWQIFSHTKKTIDAADLNLVDFKVPRTTYYGVASYLNQLQLSFRTDTEDEAEKLNQFLTSPFPKHEKFNFLKKC